jgi:hypothetical protein
MLNAIWETDLDILSTTAWQTLESYNNAAHKVHIMADIGEMYMVLLKAPFMLPNPWLHNEAILFWVSSALPILMLQMITLKNL